MTEEAVPRVGPQLHKNKKIFEVYHDCNIDFLKPTGYVMHHQFIIQQLYALSTPYMYLCALFSVLEQTARHMPYIS